MKRSQQDRAWISASRLYGGDTQAPQRYTFRYGWLAGYRAAQRDARKAKKKGAK